MNSKLDQINQINSREWRLRTNPNKPEAVFFFHLSNKYPTNLCFNLNVMLKNNVKYVELTLDRTLPYPNNLM